MDLAVDRCRAGDADGQIISAVAGEETVFPRAFDQHFESSADEASREGFFLSRAELAHFFCAVFFNGRRNMVGERSGRSARTHGIGKDVKVCKRQRSEVFRLALEIGFAFPRAASGSSSRALTTISR